MKAVLRHPITAVIGIAVVIAVGGLLYDSLSGPEGGAQTSPPARTNGEIAFDRGGDIRTISSDGSGPETNVTANSLGNNRPSYSFDGAEIAYETAEFSGGNREPAVMAADGTDRRRSGLVDSQMTSWGPPRDYELVISSPPNRMGANQVDLLVITPPPAGSPGAGSGVGPNLTHDLPGYEFFSAVSPDWTRIAFASGVSQQGPFDIWAINYDGSGAEQLTSDPADDRRPTIGPDGRLAFASKRDGDYEIYLMNADGSGVQKLTDNTVEDNNPAFSPDGRRIAYQSTISGSAQIHTMAVDGSDIVQVTTFGGTYPAWRPVLANEPPVPSAGGPYTFSEGEDFDFDASGSTDPEGDELHFRWGGESSFSTNPHRIQPWIPEEALDGPANLPDVGVAVTDGYHVSRSATGTVRLLNAPPSVTIDGPASTALGDAGSWTLTATDPSFYDQNRPMTYKVDWTSDGTVDDTATVDSGGPATLTHAFAEDSTPTISATATDKDGGESPAATKTVTVGTGGIVHSLSVTKSGEGSGTVTSTPPGIDCGSTCSAQFNQGVEVSLSAEPASGSLFSGWSGAGCSGTGLCTLSLTADASVEAEFDLSPVETTTPTPTTPTSPATPAAPPAQQTCKKGYVPKNGKCVKKKKKKKKKK